MKMVHCLRIVSLLCFISVAFAAHLKSRIQHESEKKSANNNYMERKVCKAALDIGIIMDASSSVKRKNYRKMKQFIKRLVDDFNVSPQGTHFGIIHYSNYARLDARFDESRYHSKLSVKAKIDSIAYSYGGTRTDKALRLAGRKLFCDSCCRPEARKVLIVITDGNTNKASESLDIASRFMKEQDVTILSLGIGKKISMSELMIIASEPKINNVFKVDSFDNLKSKLSFIQASACGKE